MLHDEPQGTWQHALECKAHWAARLLDGSKTIEIRAYALPDDLLGTPIALVATEGPEGQATLGEMVLAGQPDGQVVRLCAMVGGDYVHGTQVGEVVFHANKEYKTAEDFWSDEAQHGVQRGSAYGWNPANTTYGWCVSQRLPCCAPLPVPAMTRLHRSLYAKKQ